MQLEPSQPMSCSVSSSFETVNKTEIGYTPVSKINETFELSSDDISLVSHKIFSKDFFADRLYYAIFILMGQAIALSLVD